MTVTVYTKNDCVQCDMTKRLMTREGIEYTEINLEQDADAMTRVKEMGYLAAPVIVAGSEHWSGFRPERVKGLKVAQ